MAESIKGFWLSGLDRPDALLRRVLSLTTCQEVHNHASGVYRGDLHDAAFVGSVGVQAGMEPADFADRYFGTPRLHETLCAVTSPEAVRRVGAALLHLAGDPDSRGFINDAIHLRLENGKWNPEMIKGAPKMLEFTQTRREMALFVCRGFHERHFEGMQRFGLTLMHGADKVWLYRATPGADFEGHPVVLLNDVAGRTTAYGFVVDTDGEEQDRCIYLVPQLIDLHASLLAFGSVKSVRRQSMVRSVSRLEDLVQGAREDRRATYSSLACESLVRHEAGHLETLPTLKKAQEEMDSTKYAHYYAAVLENLANLRVLRWIEGLAPEHPARQLNLVYKLLTKTLPRMPEILTARALLEPRCGEYLENELQQIKEKALSETREGFRQYMKLKRESATRDVHIAIERQ